MGEELWSRICSIANLFHAWKKFSAGKHTKPDVLMYEYHLEDNLFGLREELLAGSYVHDPYQPFTVFDPKRRQIHKSTVKDRIVHQALVNVIEPFFEERFILDSFSCRKGKGTHAAVNRLRSFLRQASANDTRTIYALKCDVRKFFASVDHARLLVLLERQIQDRHTIELIEKIIGSFHASEGRGIPLGNLTSQLFANVYLNELDRFIKHGLRERYYIRYCDDFVVLTDSREKASTLIPEIDHFLWEALSLSLHPKKVTIHTWKQGVDFLGYVLLPHATVLRTKTASRILRRTNPENVMSYLGLCGHADAFELEQVVRTKVQSWCLPGLTHTPARGIMEPC